MSTKETKLSTTRFGQNNWVVYRHIRLDKDIPFYIGIGKDINRPYNKKDRSTFWKSIINKTEYIVEILFEDLTKDEIKLYLDSLYQTSRHIYNLLNNLLIINIISVLK